MKYYQLNYMGKVESINREISKHVQLEKIASLLGCSMRSHNRTMGIYTFHEIVEQPHFTEADLIEITGKDCKEHGFGEDQSYLKVFEGKLYQCTYYGELNRGDAKELVTSIIRKEAKLKVITPRFLAGGLHYDPKRDQYKISNEIANLKLSDLISEI